jgi:hypothetical protein
MARAKKYVTLDGYEVVRATENAVCIAKANVETWIPRSAIADGDTLDKGDTDLSVAEWIAIRENLDTDD